MAGIEITTHSQGAILTYNGFNAYFVQGHVQSSSGTGLIDPFVRWQDNGIEQGYNTDFRPLEPGEA